MADIYNPSIRDLRKAGLELKTSVIYMASSRPTWTAKLNLVQEKKLESKRHKESKFIIFTISLAGGLGTRSNDGWPSSYLLKPFPQFMKPNCYQACTGHWSTRNIMKFLKEDCVELSIPSYHHLNSEELERQAQKTAHVWGQSCQDTQCGWACKPCFSFLFSSGMHFLLKLKKKLPRSVRD